MPPTQIFQNHMFKSSWTQNLRKGINISRLCQSVSHSFTAACKIPNIKCLKGLKSHPLCPNSKVAVSQLLIHWAREGVEQSGNLKPVPNSVKKWNNLYSQVFPLWISQYHYNKNHPRGLVYSKHCIPLSVLLFPSMWVTRATGSVWACSRMTVVQYRRTAPEARYAPVAHSLPARKDKIIE